MIFVHCGVKNYRSEWPKPSEIFLDNVFNRRPRANVLMATVGWTIAKISTWQMASCVALEPRQQVGTVSTFPERELESHLKLSSISSDWPECTLSLAQHPPVSVQLFISNSAKPAVCPLPLGEHNAAPSLALGFFFFWIPGCSYVLFIKNTQSSIFGLHRFSWPRVHSMLVTLQSCKVYLPHPWVPF